jgi:hypothetical protein
MERAIFVADLERLPPPGEPCDRLYLGTESCAWRLPGKAELAAALDAARTRGAGFSLVTPFLDEPGLDRALALVRALPEDPALEVVANDLGLVEALRSSGWSGTLVAGRLLTRQRRGPGFQRFGDAPADARAALRGSALDAPAFVDLLGSRYGVRRFELDDLVQGVAVPALPPGVHLSLYRPWLLVTATRNCPWIFDGRTWDRSRGCARPCRGQSLRLDPADESLFGNGNGGAVARPETVLAEGWREAGAPVGAQLRGRTGGVAQRQDPAACTGRAGAGTRPLIMGGCAQFLENRNDAAPPPGVDRIVWQPEVPA